MNRIKLTLLLLTLNIINAQGQTTFSKPSYLTIDADSTIKENILKSLDNLFLQLDNEKLDTTLIDGVNRKLSIEILSSLKGTEDSEKDSTKNFYKRQLINLFPITKTEYFISIAYIGSKIGSPPILKTVFNFIAKNDQGKFVFSIPTNYLTKSWKTKKVGNIMYHFVDNINIKNAKIFDIKNKTIATKFGLKPKQLDFYLCDNYQDVLRLMGYEYDAESNGKTKSGYGVVANTIFSVMHNEDFSHDLFHFYSAKIRGSARNWYAEEGFAYCWGNAYWTKTTGETITQDELVIKLKQYVNATPQISLLILFDEQPKVFEYLSEEIGLKKIFASLICKEVEQKRGIEGVKELLNCGSGADKFFKATDRLVGVNRTNFNTEVMKLLEAYK